MSRAILSMLATLLVACGGELTDNTAETLWVYTDAGAVQCEHGGQPVAETAAILERQGVAVTVSECGHLTDRAVITVCGAGTLDINLHRIDAKGLQSAKQAGFRPVTELATDEGPGYEFTDCSGRAGARPEPTPTAGRNGS